MNPRPPDASPGRSIMGRGGKEDTMTKRMKLFIVVALASSVMLAGAWSASHAFEEVLTRGFGVRVGGAARESRAIAWLADCRAVATFLERWLRVMRY